MRRHAISLCEPNCRQPGKTQRLSQIAASAKSRPASVDGSPGKRVLQRVCCQRARRLGLFVRQPAIGSATRLSTRHWRNGDAGPRSACGRVYLQCRAGEVSRTLDATWPMPRWRCSGRQDISHSRRSFRPLSTRAARIARDPTCERAASARSRKFACSERPRRVRAHVIRGDGLRTIRRCSNRHGP
jgi:hypothetical protein